jgi:hypothetical protein
MSVEQKLLGHSELASVSHSAAFAVPQMDFESDAQGRSASFQMRMDGLVKKHVEVRKLARLPNIAQTHVQMRHQLATCNASACSTR